MSIREETRKMKQIAPLLAGTEHGVRIDALRRVKEALLAGREEIFAANKRDLERAEENRLSDAVKKRLKFDEGKLQDVCAGIDQLVSLKDPVGEVTLERKLDSDLVLRRVTVPLGVLGVIFEARPDALVQIASLCVKSGNCAVLKGGSETRDTNAVLFEKIYKAVTAAGLPEGCLLQADTHGEIDELLACEGEVDLIIPRGSNAFVRYIMEHTKIPVMGHADGICHTYIDGAADMEKVVPLVLDAKLQYTAACNATETILIDKAYPKKAVDELFEALKQNSIRLHGDEAASELTGDGIENAALTKEAVAMLEPLGEDGYGHEYLEPELSVRFVDGVEEAVSHINRYGSHHTDCIITEDAAAADYFLKYVDSAGVYQNASTRFADGFRYGFGAEVGISTGKLHARGPVGLFGLCTYKYTLVGNGNIVGDYASGKRQFHFQDL
ncbi:MAG: glutamate-5-semialdehyde dehydrogenase [Lachnospiraceae bacterium]|nr:glutamate-5-semialdehyde dehydrogenase [Lachnospiraceae bacterium]